jgi:biopolymer transport protein TolR
MINQEQVEMNMLGGRLREIYEVRQDKTIFIRAHAKVPYRYVIEMIDIAKGAGVDITGIIPEYITED